MIDFLGWERFIFSVRDFLHSFFFVASNAFFFRVSRLARVMLEGGVCGSRAGTGVMAGVLGVELSRMYESFHDLPAFSANTLDIICPRSLPLFDKSSKCIFVCWQCFTLIVCKNVGKKKKSNAKTEERLKNQKQFFFF